MSQACVVETEPASDDGGRIARLLERYVSRIPRYTSYPTAAQFLPLSDDGEHRVWLAAIPADPPVSLYLHIPFCDRLCWYCGCHTGVVNTRAPVARYVAALEREIALVAAALPARLKVSAIHFGGGTPNSLLPEDLGVIFTALHTHFDVLPEAEIAAELDPSTLRPEWVAAARAVGLNRASLGVQDFDPLVQEAINRAQSLELVGQCVTWLREAGVASVNLDLMYGLPHQTVDKVVKTVADAAGLAPDRVSLFGYAHVPWMKPAQKLLPEAALPDTAERFAQAEAAAVQLQALGYARVGLDHFARHHDFMAEAENAGRLRRNFQGYTTDAASTLLGFGASSISRLPGAYAQNHSSVPAWHACIEAGKLPSGRGVALTEDDFLRADIIERLMCDLQADLPAIAGAHGALAATVLDTRARHGLLAMELDDLVVLTQRDGDIAVVNVTEAGRPFVRNVCALFDAYLATTKGRHSASV